MFVLEGGCTATKRESSSTQYWVPSHTTFPTVNESTTPSHVDRHHSAPSASKTTGAVSKSSSANDVKLEGNDIQLEGQ